MTMDTNSKPFSGYDTGYDFWRDNAVSYGIDEAIIISNNYLDMNLKSEHSDDERQFCREIFAAVYEATVDRDDPTKIVYPYDFKEANERGEVDDYHESRRRNGESARGIDELIYDSCYKTNFYNLEIAAMIAVLRYGFTRVNMILAFNIQKREYDGRYSSANKRWANTVTVPEKAFNGSYLNAHACLVDSFTGYVRKLQGE